MHLRSTDVKGSSSATEGGTAVISSLARVHIQGWERLEINLNEKSTARGLRRWMSEKDMDGRRAPPEKYITKELGNL